MALPVGSGVCVCVVGTAGRRRKHLASLHDREVMALWVAAGAGGLPLETSCGHCLPGEGMLGREGCETE